MNVNDLVKIELTNQIKIAYLSEDCYEEEMLTVVEPQLQQLRKTVEVPVQGGTIHMENYALPDSDKAVLMMHGYTESAEKFRELAWYFFQAGFSVYTFDQRGHGRSVRALQDESITHVDHFSDYLDDADQLIEQVVKPECKGKQLYLFGHSMGGAVAAHFLQRHPDLFKRAVLSSPMIAPSTGSIPMNAARLLAGYYVKTGRAKQRAFVGKPYDAQADIFASSCTTSSPRFQYYRNKRVANRYLQNCSPTYGWTSEAINQTKQIMNRTANSAIKIPVLLCQAEMDTVVLLPPQEEYIKLLPFGKLVRFPAKHELFFSTDDVMTNYVQTVLNFLLE